MKRSALLLLMTVILTGASLAVAQERDSGPPRRTERSAEDREKMQEMMVWRIVKYLDLNEDQSAKFLPIIKDFFGVNDKIRIEQRQILETLFKTVDDETVPVGDLKNNLARLLELREQEKKGQEAFLERVKGIINDRQFVKIRLFEDKLKHDLFRRFRNMRGERGANRSAPPEEDKK